MKCLFIYNPNCGKGKIKRKSQYIINKLKEKFEVVDVIETSYPRHATVLAKESCARYDYLIVAGGDGTFSEVVNGLGEAKDKPIIGYIPCGTVNDLAHSLYIPRSIKGAVKNILNGVGFKHDVFKINDSYGIYVCSTGLFTETSYNTKQVEKRKLGKLAYYLYGSRLIFKSQSIDFKLRYQDKTVSSRCALILITNSRSVAGFRINRRAKLNDGLADVLVLENQTKKVKLKDIVKAAKVFLLGLNSYKIDRKIKYYRLKEFDFETNDDVAINVDGEKAGNGSFNFKMIKENIEILVPKRKIARLNRA